MDVCRPDSLLPALHDTWAHFFSLWHSAMEKQIGTPFWGFSAQNEPLAHGHMWGTHAHTRTHTRGGAHTEEHTHREAHRDTPV